MRLPVTCALLAAALAVVALPAAAADPNPEHGTYSEPDEGFDAHVEGASRLEGQLLAPCCWDSSRQTLDIHDSPIALELKREIRGRLRAGESEDAIKADLIERYSNKILAVPPGNPLKEVAIVLFAVVFVAGVGMIGLLTRWKRRAAEDLKKKRAQPTAESAKERDRWDERLERELEELE